MRDEEWIVLADRSVSLRDVLNDLGYEIWRVPLQIACPVHKLGQEERFSARFYKEEDQSVWCFVCSKHFYATDIWSAMKGVDKKEAALEILAKWPVSEEKSREILRNSTIPRPVVLTGVYREILEKKLIEYRGLLPFPEYRKWALEIDTVGLEIEKLPQEDREKAVRSFVSRLDKAFHKVLEGVSVQ